MAEIPDVVGGETILTSWGNPIRDRTIQRYADATERATLLPVPTLGDASYLKDTDSLELYNGASWTPQARRTGDTFSGNVVVEALNPADFVNIRTNRLIDADTIAGRLGVNSSGGVQLSYLINGSTSGNFSMHPTLTTFSMRIAATGLTTTATILIPNGSEGSPSVAFSNYPGSGLFASNATNIRFSTESVERFRITTSQNNSYVPLKMVGDTPVDQGLARNIHVGVGTPDAGLGQDGDLYFRREG